MAGLLGAFTNLIAGRPWSDLPPSFCYSIGEKKELPYFSIFTLFDGFKLSSPKEKVSIFVFDKKNTGASVTGLSNRQLAFARNCLKYIRTIRHPNVLRVFEAVEVNSGIYIATEYVTPLVSSDFSVDPVWGIYQVALAIDFLNESCNVIHGLVCPYAVFVTEQGAHWRLGTFDGVRPTSDIYLHSTDHPLRTAGFNPPHNIEASIAVDRWGLASIIGWSYAKTKEITLTTSNISIDPVMNIDYIPQPIKKMFQKQRVFAESDLVKTMLFFTEINLKGSWDKEQFFSSLPDMLGRIAPQSQFLQILPQIGIQLDFFGQPALLLPSIFVIAENLQKAETLSDAQKEQIYKKEMIPVILKFFKYPDRAVRYSLLQNLNTIEPHLSAEDIADIFDPVCVGFTDSEVTLKSMVLFLPQLANSNYEKAIQKMGRMFREDPEGAIRTNVIICFAKLANTIASKSQGPRILATTLLKGLRDTFPPCRLAALQSLAMCSSYFTAEDIVSRILPSVSPRCIDSDVRVRQVAFLSVEHLIEVAKTQVLAAPVDGQTTTGATPSEKTSVSSKHDKTSSSSWTGWALKRAVEFYSKASNKNESMPSGKFTPVPPSPPSPLANNNSDFPDNKTQQSSATLSIGGTPIVTDLQNEEATICPKTETKINNESFQLNCGVSDDLSSFSDEKGEDDKETNGWIEDKNLSQLAFAFPTSSSNVNNVNTVAASASMRPLAPPTIQENHRSIKNLVSGASSAPKSTKPLASPIPKQALDVSTDFWASFGNEPSNKSDDSHQQFETNIEPQIRKKDFRSILSAHKQKPKKLNNDDPFADLLP